MTKPNAREEIREEILDAAERLMSQYGYRKMTMGDLASAAGIGVGTTYLYFPGKDQVALAVIERVQARVLDQLRALAQSPQTAATRLREMLTARVMLRFQMASPHPPEHREEFRRAVEAALQQKRTCWQMQEAHLFADVLRDGQARGEFASFDSAEELAQTLLLGTSGLMPRNLRPEEFSEPDAVRARAERLAALLIDGVTAHPRVNAANI